MNRKLALAAIAVLSLIITVKYTHAQEVKTYNCPDGGKHCVTIDVGGGGKHIYHKGN